MLSTNYQTRFQSIEHKKKDMLFRRNETIEEANEKRFKINNYYLEQKTDKWDTSCGKVFIYCDSINQHFKEVHETNDYMKILHHYINTRLLNGELKKDDDTYDMFNL